MQQTLLTFCSATSKCEQHLMHSRQELLSQTIAELRILFGLSWICYQKNLWLVTGRMYAIINFPYISTPVPGCTSQGSIQQEPVKVDTSCMGTCSRSSSTYRAKCVADCIISELKCDESVDDSLDVFSCLTNFVRQELTSILSSTFEGVYLKSSLQQLMLDPCH